MTLLDLLGLSITLTFIGGIVWLVARAMFHKPTREPDDAHEMIPPGWEKRS